MNLSKFSDFELSSSTLSQLNELGFDKATAIQTSTLAASLAGQDVVATAKTGSGKTLAFALPLIENLSTSIKPKGKGNLVRALVLAPTRELAEQISQNFTLYSKGASQPLKVVTVIGGMSINPQMLKLRGGADVVVATPGRLLDLVEKNAVNLTQVRQLVLDEADRIFSLGFKEELNAIFKLLPSKRQTLMFSATFPLELQQTAKKHLYKPLTLVQESETVEAIEQRVITVNKENKTALLEHLCKQHDWSQVLIFVNAKNTCKNLANKLEKRGIKAEVFHGDKAQVSRSNIIRRFKDKQLQVLIATDLAARGLDVEGLPVVINYELPRSPADYMHRIGRSGRAGKQGVAISLISHEEFHHFKIIEKKNKLRLTREQVVGFEADDNPELVEAGKPKVNIPAPGQGKKYKNKAAKANSHIWNKTPK
ncbi:DEAD/DEAH box helicase [Paraferrimonas sp. SM1919]|uniref:DEAD/DEAH box helicase n=1 Tax=Paraferrimonas sp. SM1919 TaxID=2662263 RepID=UPI0013D8498F|nr:DEAD/DEAH box helicase [Paraferrimonas sp. SM1919]